MNQAIIPVQDSPGEYYVPSLGRKIKLVEFRDTSKYDTIELRSGTTDTANGSEQDFFKNLNNKQLIDSNLTTPSRVSKGEEMLIKWVGCDIPLYNGNTRPTVADVLRVGSSAYMRWTINDFTIAEGAASQFPSGYGFSGQTTENSSGILGIGVPSTAARRDLEKVHYIDSERDINAKIRFYARGWVTTAISAPSLDGQVLVRCHFGGMLGKAATK